jgi:hypothetical protein
MAPVMWAPRTVVRRSDAKIAAQVSGCITWIAEGGAYLAAGDLIATVTPVPFNGLWLSAGQRWPSNARHWPTTINSCSV